MVYLYDVEDVNFSLENTTTFDRIIAVKECYCSGQGKSPSVRSRRTRVQRVECFVQSDR